MENGQLHDDKLFRAVHDRLSDYEAPYNGADWDAMSRSLDALPKATGFQWKISLNSVLVGLGLIGISALGYAFAGHSDNSTTKSEPQVSVSNNVRPVNTNLTVSTPSPSSGLPQTNAVPENTSLQMQADAMGSTNGFAGANEVQTNTDGTVKRKRSNNQNTLLFGDQIDRRKGFIYQTKEDNNLVTHPVADPDPNVFYDADNGVVKRITLHKDSSTVKTEKKKPADSAATTSDKAGAPTDGEQRGFDY